CLGYCVERLCDGWVTVQQRRRDGGQRPQDYPRYFSRNAAGGRRTYLHGHTTKGGSCEPPSAIHAGIVQSSAAHRAARPCTYLLACSARTRKNSYTTLSPCCCVKNPRACSASATLVPSILFFVVLPLDTITPVGSLSSWPGPDAEASRPSAMNRMGVVLLVRTSNAQTLSSVFSWS